MTAAYPPVVVCDHEPVYEYRPIIVCDHEHPSFCRLPRDTRTTEGGTRGSFPTFDAALGHGVGIARNVYGSDIHHVVIEARGVHPWEETL